MQGYCLTCQSGWMILEDNLFCGYCGCKTFDYEIRFRNSNPFLYSDEKNQDLEIEIQNTGSLSIDFNPISIRSNKKDVRFSESQQNFTVNPAVAHTQKIRANPKEFPLNLGEIFVSPSSQGKIGTQSLPIKFLPAPSFILKDETGETAPILSYNQLDTTKELDLYLDVQQSKFYIEKIEIQSEAQWLRRIGFSSTLPHGLDLGLKRIRLEVAPNQLSDGLLNSANLYFTLRGYSKEIEKTVEILAKKTDSPAKLRFGNPGSLQIFQGMEKTISLRIENIGESPLELISIETISILDIVELSTENYPLMIEGGQSKDMRLQIQAANTVPGLHHIDFVVNSNCSDNPRWISKLGVQVDEMSDYLGYMAIDFGTTNSCCALINEKGEPKLIDIEGQLENGGGLADSQESSSKIMPSVIVYPSSTKQVEYYVGYAAEDFRTSPTDSPYYVNSVKRWLGYRWKRQFPHSIERQPGDVVTDILRHIIHQVENVISQKVTKCVATHPTMFRPDQKEDLRLAFGRLGIKDLLLVDEASAASLGVIYERARKKGCDNYRLLVYDFGGGTVDIVLSEINSDNSSISAEPLSRGGHLKFGGDNVTQAIVDFIVQKFSRGVQSHAPDKSQIEIPFIKPTEHLQHSYDNNIDNARRLNTAILYQAAERMKRSLTTDKTISERFNLGIVDNQEGVVKYISDFISGESDLLISFSSQQLKEIVEPHLNQTLLTIDSMIAEADGVVPEIIVLAGQSSRMQCVEEVIANHFLEKHGVEVEIYLDKNPKGCVSIGAAQYGLSHAYSGEGQLKTADLSNKTYSRFGIVTVDYGQKIFSEIIPRGKVIPEESKGTMPTPLRSRDVLFEVYEHFDIDDSLSDSSSKIGEYNLKLNESITLEQMETASLEMQVKEDGVVELKLDLGDTPFELKFQRQEPAFVDEISLV